MPLIKPRTRGKQLVKHRTRLDCENNETLYAYAQFLGESTEYVLNQVIDTVLARDKEFVKWRESHQGSYVPRTHDRLRPEERWTAPASTQVPPRPEKQPSPLTVRRVGVPCSARLLKRALWSPWRCPVESVSGVYARTPFRTTMCSSG